MTLTSLTGKKICWTFDDGPMPNTRIEHMFNEDGSVTWLITEGEYKGATRTEKSSATVRVNAQTWVVSYLAASGHTLTIVLSLTDGRAIGFGSNDKSWEPLHGTFEILN